MSVSSEVQRTLVKSPPELWAELSDPVALARHLGELGEIHIVATEPERTVDWEAATDGAEISGRVEIAPSGWGTRVTLSASRMIAEPEPEPESKPAFEPAVAIEPEPAAEPGPAAEPEAIEVIPEPESEPEPELVEPEPRPRFFARLFRRRKGRSEPEPTVESEPVAAAEIEEPTLEEPTLEEPTLEEPTLEETVSGEAMSEEPAPDTPETPAADISAELAELEEQTTAVLTAVLDRLGAAHHRPFSRA
jgi:hypothetical protein